ncbi:PAS domain-containing sensor histidine kinase [Rickettsiella endosymbiont of Dermanyssus gallinae]|uniref:PAS domain-containing sensor histidine kinase n=1 Tax=Rickettsiella endosymbiont of Dermanyssus gallinae TaxID=2856608 RepID=UPI001C52B372|nr:PAS domain-containing sensor histidine kinase [Rickettsiella endosymbiont of Dermanyssus gallinae]
MSEKKTVDPIATNIIANSPGFIYWKNKKGQYMGCNNELARISGLNDRSEIVGKTDDDFEWGKGQAEQFRAADLEVMHDKCVKVYEDRMPIKKPDGHYLYIRTEKRPLYEDGKIIGVVANAFDITDQKVLEEKLKEQKEISEQANLAKTEFIRNIEHDIRTPFNGIWGVIHLLWEQETDPFKKELLGDVTQCAKEFLDYFNEMFDFSKISSGLFPVMEKKFNLQKLLDSVLKMEMPAAKNKNLPLSSYLSKDLPQIVMGDHYRLCRLLINLVSNAIKFTKEGQVSIHVKLLNKTDDSYLIRFTIKDTGEGIPLEQQNHIFEKFSRLSPSNKGLYKGSGLGLGIVKQFIEEMKGEIDLKSKLGEGTEFICTIPFKIPLTNDFA